MSRRMAVAAFALLVLAMHPYVSVVAASPAPGDAGTEAYIVTLRSSGRDPGEIARMHAAREASRVTSVYRHALQGYAATMTPAAADRFRRDPEVLRVERDGVMSIAGQTLPTGSDRVGDPEVSGSVGPNLPIDGQDDQRVDVDIAVVDTAVESSHPDLNVVASIDCTSGTCKVGNGLDGNGHGTHVAGSAAALDNRFGAVGVAPGARIWSVKVLNDNGSGSFSMILAGIDWIAARANLIEVANMSLGCLLCSSGAVTDALTRSVASGITYAVAAGNDGRDAANFFPANHPDVITVSALADFDGLSGGAGAAACRPDVDDTLADFSNWGGTVELAAPGACIYSTWRGNTYNTISGTSMASPHVAGAAALLASQAAYHGDPALIESTLVSSGNTNWVDDSGDGVQEPLLYVSSFTPVLLATAPPIGVSVGNVWVAEGDEGTSTAVVPVTLSAPVPPGQVFTVNAATANSTATAGADYMAVPPTTLTFTEGETAESVSVSILADVLAEGNEMFVVNLTSPTGGVVVADSQATATVVDEEGPLSVSIANVWAPEGSSGASTPVELLVTLSRPATHPVTAKAATANSTALGGSDYVVLPSTTVAFATGESSKTVSVTVVGDDVPEGNEIFLVNLSAPTGAMVLGDSQAVATIADEEGPISASVANVSVVEGDSGATPALFTVSLSSPPAAGQTLTLKAATANGTAMAGSDYTALSATTVSFGPGEASKTVSVDVSGDTVAEVNETFVVNLTLPTGGLVLADSQATATVVNDD